MKCKRSREVAPFELVYYTCPNTSARLLSPYHHSKQWMKHVRSYSQALTTSSTSTLLTLAERQSQTDKQTDRARERERENCWEGETKRIGTRHVQRSGFLKKKSYVRYSQCIQCVCACARVCSLESKPYSLWLYWGGSTGRPLCCSNDSYAVFLLHCVATRR